TYLVFLFKCSRIAHFEERFKFFKLFFLVIVAVSLSESVTFYFDSPNSTLSILSFLCSFTWFLHFCFLVKRDPRHQFVAQLFINADVDDGLDGNLLQCDERKSYRSQLFFGWVGPLLDRGVHEQIGSSADLFELP